MMRTGAFTTSTSSWIVICTCVTLVAESDTTGSKSQQTSSPQLWTQAWTKRRRRRTHRQKSTLSLRPPEPARPCRKTWKRTWRRYPQCVVTTRHPTPDLALHCHKIHRHWCVRAHRDHHRDHHHRPSRDATMARMATRTRMRGRTWGRRTVTVG
ncbi:hypothetical protein B0H17DRAFT_459006 [Mycena rosella]|uniref:Secreted protein n=1 Tax=Mycena rosella TaxID=1033263 RepID=A0AAD7C9T5_MYCRO|nr:hypothetical protein B0H17DRAFT_459006 [Mycena rosella]